MFLANMVSKMKHDTPLGSRIAEVHNGSSLFTGDAGQGESNIRRWILENDWLEAIIALPLNMFYNTGIATYIWVLSNRKPEHRRGKVQLIDATNWFQPLRKNLGNKNCQFSDEDRQRIMQAFMDFKETEQSKIFPNAAFGYWKITVERPLRLHSQFTKKAIEALRFNSGDQELRRELFARFGQVIYEEFGKVRPEIEKILSAAEVSDESDDDEEGQNRKPAVPEKRRKKLLDEATWERDRKLLEAARKLAQTLGENLFEDHILFQSKLDKTAKELGIKLSASDRKAILNAVSWRVENAVPVIATVHKPEKVEADPLHGRYSAKNDGKPAIVEYEPDSELRDTEQVPLLEDGGIEAFFRREVLPYVSDAWIDEGATKTGYEISFTRHFYKPQPLRTLEEIRADIVAQENEVEGLMSDIVR
jgi:type I restriction enzyme M protein